MFWLLLAGNRRYPEATLRSLMTKAEPVCLHNVVKTPLATLQIDANLSHL